MTHKFYFRKVFLIVMLLVVYSACNTVQEDHKDVIAPIETIENKKVPKDYDKKKGIEIMANYIADLMRPLGAKKSTYKDGFLITEHQKAMKNAFRSKSKNASTIEWQERGPNNVPGRIRGIVVAPDNLDKWYAGTVGGGLWVTEDAGTVWRNLTDFKVPSLSTSTVVVSEKNPKTLYLGTGEPFNNLDAVGGIGILKTIDEGLNWEYLDTTRGFGGIGRLALNPDDDTNLIAASRNGIYVTTDGGLTWQNTYSGGNVQDLNHDPRDFNTLYAGVNSIGVIKSIDGGLTWDLILDREDYNPNHERFELDVSPANPNKVFVSVYTPGGNATTGVNTDLYMTDDAGETFNLLGYEGEPAAANLVTGQGWYNNLMMAHPFNENVFYVGGVVVYRVQIGKKARKTQFKKEKPDVNLPGAKRLTFTFQPIAAGYNGELNNYVHVDQHGLTWAAKPKEKKFKLILANDGGVYNTDYLADPGTTLNDWSTAAVGLNNTQFYGADKRNGVEDYMAGAQDNGTWISFTDGQANSTTAYRPILGGDGFEVLWNYEDPNKYIGGSQYNNFARYVNGQGAFVGHGESGQGTSPFYSKITSSNNNPDVLFSPSISGVWRTTNFAETWSLTPIPNNFSVGASSALDVSVSTANPDIVWAGNAMTESGSFVMHVSQDNGLSYSPAGLFSDPRSDRSHNYFAAGIESSPTNENRAYVLFSGQGAAKVLRTEDLGQTWEDISGFSTGEDRGFPDVAIHSLVEMPYDENVLWVGTDIGVFQTLDAGKSWSILEGLPAFSVWELKVVNNQVVMATHGRGVWTATLQELNGYEPPSYFGPPTIVNVSQESVENQNVVVTYTQNNEDAEAVLVYLDGVEIGEITDNITPGVEFTYTLEGIEEGTHTVGFKVRNTQQETSVLSSAIFDVIDFKTPAALVNIQTFQNDDVYTYNGEFVINTVNETVSQPVLNNSDHPYIDNSEYRTVLKYPVIVSESNRNFRYEDVAITEFDPTPGRFYDFVAVEASSDLNTWVRLDTYDAERFQEWTDVFNSSPTPDINDDLFKEQTIDLLNFFQAGDVVVFRFRLISDPLFNSFGWAIRSINSQEEIIVEEEIKILEAPILYPTISTGEVFISSKTAIYNGRVEVYGLNGLLVHTEKVGTLDNSSQSLSLDNLRTGIYLVKVFGDGVITNTSRVIIR